MLASFPYSSPQLFYDLAFVAASIKLSAFLKETLTMQAFGYVILIFVLLWSSWYVKCTYTSLIHWYHWFACLEGLQGGNEHVQHSVLFQ